MPAGSSNDEAAGESAVQRLPSLSSSLCEIGFAMLARDSTGQPLAAGTLAELEQEQAYVHERIEWFDRQSLAEQITLLQVFFGTFARSMAETWRRIDRGGLLQPPFHAPHNAALTLHARWAWLRRLVKWAAQRPPEPLDAEWFIQRGSDYGGSVFEPAVAVEIDRGDEHSGRLFELVCARLRQLHGEVSADFGECTFLRRVLLCAARPSGWQLVFSNFKHAVPAFDHRSDIGKAAMWGHPLALLEFVRFLLADVQLLEDPHVYLRLCGLLALVRDETTLDQLVAALSRWLTLCQDSDQRALAIHGRDPRDVQLGLWAQGWADVDVAIGACRQLLDDADPRIRYVAANFVRHSEFSAAIELRARAVDDPDLRVATCAALQPIFFVNTDEDPFLARMFQPYVHAMLRLLQRLSDPAPQYDSPEWPFPAELITVEDMSELLTHYAKLFLTDMLPQRALFGEKTRKYLEHLRDRDK